MTTLSSIRLIAINQARQQLFGDSSLTVYSTTPEDGETSAGEFAEDWFGHRVQPVTNMHKNEAGAWQFQVLAEDDWETSQDYMLAVVALTVDSRRWKVTKVEKPVGVSLMWKLKAELQ